MQRVVPELITRETLFKFAADKRILYLLNSKHCGRGGSCKFITIYPSCEDAFRVLADRLLELTDGFSGPYILSDRRYKSSSVIYYRYGGFQKLTRVNSGGGRDHFIFSPDGQMVRDIRHPYFHLPEWITDPFGIEEEDPYPDNTLQAGRFRIEDALAFTNAGGIYVGTDTNNGNKVLIKEARPFVYVAGTQSYATDLLAREFEMLSRLSALDVSPKPIAHFREWEHHYLVEEFIEGDTIARHWGKINILLRQEATHEERLSYHHTYFRVGVAACRLLETLHENGVVFGDLSPNNVMINSDATILKVIDLESVARVGEIGAPSLYTPGFAKRSQGRSRAPKDDYFALGSILSFMLFPFNRLFPLDESAIYRLIPQIVYDSGFPEELSEIVLGLMDADTPVSFALSDVAERLERLADEARTAVPVNLTSRVSTREKDFGGWNEDEGIGAAVNGLISFVLANIDYSRSDRFFPASSDVLSRNPYCLANGLAGVAEMLISADRAIPETMRESLTRVPAILRELPPGLFSGVAGIAQVLWNCGLHDEALRCAHSLCDRQDVFADPFYENGTAGAGITALYLYGKSGDKALLSFAERAAEHLLNSAVIADEGYSWAADRLDYGLGNGSSGVALFLLYTYLATRNHKYLAAGESALRFDLVAGRELKDGALAWEHMGSTSGILYPYWLHGSAGVGEVVLRYLVVTGKPMYGDALARISRYVCRKYTVFPGLGDGLCGLGHFLLNCAALLGDSEYERQARVVAAGVQLHLLRREEGLAVCGDARGKISCDYATGSAGVVIFLSSLARPGTFSLFPDDSIPSKVEAANFNRDMMLAVGR